MNLYCDLCCFVSISSSWISWIFFMPHSFIAISFQRIDARYRKAGGNSFDYHCRRKNPSNFNKIKICGNKITIKSDDELERIGFLVSLPGARKDFSISESRMSGKSFHKLAWYPTAPWLSAWTREVFINLLLYKQTSWNMQHWLRMECNISSNLVVSFVRSDYNLMDSR